jgi:hypothetical protein
MLGFRCFLRPVTHADLDGSMKHAGEPRGQRLPWRGSLPEWEARTGNAVSSFLNFQGQAAFCQVFDLKPDSDRRTWAL